MLYGCRVNFTLVCQDVELVAELANVLFSLENNTGLTVRGKRALCQRLQAADCARVLPELQPSTTCRCSGPAADTGRKPATLDSGRDHRQRQPDDRLHSDAWLPQASERRSA